MSSVGSKVDDLEEGEIEEDALEDISDCSLSEALVMQKDLEQDSEVELLRMETLKSLQEDDEVTEEELYRLEALRSLLTNIESSEKISPAEEIRKKKRKHKKKNRRQKAAKLENNEVLETVNTLEESELLVEAPDERSVTSQVDNSCPNMDFSDKENQTDSDMNLVTRPWYPKTDFALLNLYATEISKETKQQPKKTYGIDDFIIIPRILSVANNATKSTIHEPIPMKKPVNQSLRLNHLRMPVTRTAVPISKLNYPVLPSAAHLSRYKKVTKHQIQKYPVTQPTNRFSPRNVKKGKYKIVNKSCYSLKKSVNASPAKTEKQTTQSKSVYSLNRVQSRPAPSKNSQFIIEFDEDESGKEDNGSVVPVEKLKSKKSPSEKRKLVELPRRELPDVLIQKAESGSLVESNTEMSPLVVEQESNVENFETFAELGNEGSADLQNDEEMPLLEVTKSTALMTSCYDTSPIERFEHNSPDMYSVKMTDETEATEMIPDVVAESHTVSCGTLTDDREFSEPEISKMIPAEDEEYDGISPSFSREMNSLNPSEMSKITPDVVENCDTDFLPPSNSVIGRELLTEEPELSNVVACSVEDYDKNLVIKEEPFDYESDENLSMKDDTECAATNDAESEESKNFMVLQDVEADLIEIRARLLLNLGELEVSIRKDESEREKLNTMLRKLLILKSSVLKFENKIRAHQSKLSIHADTVQALFKDIADRSESCTQMKDVCFRVGMEIMGPQYKPPDLYENVIEEKINAIDFTKYMPMFK